MTGEESSTAPARAGSTASPTVLQVLPHMDAGGVVRGTIEVAGALIAAGGRAVVASAGGAGVAELERLGAAHALLPVDRKNPFVIRRNRARLAAVIDAHGVDIVHARSRAPAWSAIGAARARGRPFVTTFHGTYGHRTPFKRAYNRVMVRGERVIAISHHIADHIETVYGVGGDRVVVIPRGVDPARFDAAAVPEARVENVWRRWGVGEDQRVVLLPGRLSRWKGQTVLIEALAKLGRADVAGVLLGDAQGRDRYVDELEGLVAARGLRFQVRVAPPERDMAAAYLAADVVVSASTEPEAFGRVAIEAQAMGRPIVATDHGGSRETVIDGVTGFRVAPNDADALAAGLARALDLTPEERVAMARKAVAHVRQSFTTETMCARTLSVYRSLLRARAS